MLIKFFALQQDTETGELSEKFLTSEPWAEMKTGTRIVHRGTRYQVDRLHWEDQRAGILRATCLELAGAGTTEES
jgi:hypothetical protein